MEQSKQTTESTVSELLETHSMLRADTTALLERMRDANGMIQEVLGSAQTNLGSIEQVLTTRIGEFVSSTSRLLEDANSTTGKMDQHVQSSGTFYGMSSKVMGEFGDLAARFDGHGRALADAVELLERSNASSTTAVEERKAAIESLVAAVSGRTEDLDERLKRFSTLLDDSLRAAEERARDVARLVAEATSEGARSIAEQHAALRSATEGQTQRTREALRELYEQASGDSKGLFEQNVIEAQQLLQQSTDRFAEIMHAMKQMSGDMQRELDGTREELRRGVLKLPEETAESAAQMRRVIVDQMEALAELNRIVARHGRGLDTATAEVPARRGYREEASVASAASRQDGARHTAARSEAVSVPAAPPAAASRSRVEAPSVAPAGQNGSAPGRSGWLSELLTRASREGEDAGRTEERQERQGQGFAQPRHDERGGRPEERNARHTIESLDSLSVDIARMIDHDAAAELWERYNRGERNVFTRRLYTMQGQKAFEEVRRRYKSDREFHTTVDRYIGEFERLLNEVSRDDRGQVLARNYLTSETGKVYTMLAHAAGRFE